MSITKTPKRGRRQGFTQQNERPSTEIQRLDEPSNLGSAHPPEQIDRITIYARDGLYYQGALIVVLAVSAFGLLFEGKWRLSLFVFSAVLFAIVYLARSRRNS